MPYDLISVDTLSVLRDGILRIIKGAFIGWGLVPGMPCLQAPLVDVGHRQRLITMSSSRYGARPPDLDRSRG